MNVEKAEKILIKRGIPRRFANRYAVLLMKRGGQIKAVDVWNIREDIKLETRIKREWPGLAVFVHPRTHINIACNVKDAW